MNTVTALLLSIFIAILMVENYGYGYWMISRPVVGGAIVGLLMGDITTGLIVGGSVELMYMGILPIGGSVPPNAQIAGMLSTVFAITNGGNPEIGIALALPIGMLAQILIMLAWNINIFLMHVADKHLQKGEIRKVELIHLSGLITFFMVFFIPTFLAINFGSDYVNQVVSSMPTVLVDGLKVASGILPAVGMAMLLKMMNFRKYWSFFLIGFVFSVYLKLNVLAVSLIGVGIIAAVFALRGDSKKAEADDFDDFGDEEEDAEDLAGKIGGILTKKELVKTYIRSFFSMTSINYERYTSLGFCYAMIPALKKLYPNREDLHEALLRHNEFFNCHPYTGNAILGVSLALEEQKAMGKPITAEAISSAKAALMGPLSGIGDSIFKATFMTIFAAIGAGMALEGNILGPVVFLVPNVALNVLSRWYFIKYGHKLGTSLVSKMKSSDILEKFVEGATIVGMMVVGAMIVSFVKINIAYVWKFGGKEIVVQDLINAIIPSLLPILVVLGFYNILKKNKKGMYICVLASFILGILGKAVGMF
ncbi:PTS system, mannose-specific IID component [Clostridium amylolyticum]|uniref:PTS system, mannose-specific IID component n=1 Tax=Clostridium amylolyticum TaxID=1121298 RepID=A0A1M6NH56_9CLOT|nr:PTS system mannose/fructose/sorbose family transporter subunit IID [Clostridium amylolyticum]SHJ95030.1 PTS system, mannose-specific IID component [Clostridium amylolyticum]